MVPLCCEVTSIVIKHVLASHSEYVPVDNFTPRLLSSFLKNIVTQWLSRCVLISPHAACYVDPSLYSLTQAHHLQTYVMTLLAYFLLAISGDHHALSYFSPRMPFLNGSIRIQARFDIGSPGLQNFQLAPLGWFEWRVIVSAR
jgi:hypothetical protein